MCSSRGKFARFHSVQIHDVVPGQKSTALSIVWRRVGAVATAAEVGRGFLVRSFSIACADSCAGSASICRAAREGKCCKQDNQFCFHVISWSNSAFAQPLIPCSTITHHVG